jgi:hypothetical protein
MGKITEENLIQDLDFSCARCSAECTKINALEPELGYVSKVDGKFVGPLCQKCFDEIPKNEKVIKKLPETAFLVIVKQDGEGVFLSPEMPDITYKREATSNDVITACHQLIRDIQEAIFAQKLTGMLLNAASQAKNASGLKIIK